MESLAVFLVKNIIIAGVLFFFYILALRGRKFHRYNRFYLLGTLLISLFTPLINLRLYSYSFNIHKDSGSITHAILTKEIVVKGFSTQEIILFAFAAITMTMIICWLLKILWVYRMIRIHEVQRMNGYNFIESGLKEAPFTFLDNLFWKKTISLKENAGQKIFAHELVHIREKHTYDKLFSQFVLSFFWMNPFYWFIQRELNLVHEFLADAKSIKENDVASFAEMLLRSHNEGSYLDPVHPFFTSPVKRRLDMITNSVQPCNNYITRLTVFPIVGVIIVLFSFTLTDTDLSDKTFYPQLTSLIKTGTNIKQGDLPGSTTTIKKNETPRNMFNANKTALNPGKEKKAKKSYKKDIDQKQARHFGEDKLAGIEKREELQKQANVNKDKGQTSEKNSKDDYETKGMRKKVHINTTATKGSLKLVDIK